MNNVAVTTSYRNRDISLPTANRASDAFCRDYQKVNFDRPRFCVKRGAGNGSHPSLSICGAGLFWRAGLYKPQFEAGAGQFAGREMGLGTAVAEFSQAFASSERQPLVLNRFNSLAERYGQWREWVSAKFHEWDLAPNLAEDIGSIRWFRGIGTMFGLSALALLFWPDFAPVEAAQPMQIDDMARDEFRSQMIMPLGLGGDSGRHMAATRAVVPLKSAPERPQIELVATLAQGDSFARMLQRAGLASSEANDVTSRVASSMSLADIQPGTKVDIVLGRRTSPGAPRPLDALSFRARFDLEIKLERRAGNLVLEPHPIRVDTTPLRIRGKVGSSLYRSARAAGAPAKSVQQYLRAVSEQTDLNRALGANDEFDLIVSYKRAATGEVETGDLLYAGVVRGGKPRIQLMRWGKEGQFFEASGVGEQRSGLLAPVPGRKTSSYGMRRHPILGYKRMHAGIDFRAVLRIADLCGHRRRRAICRAPRRTRQLRQALAWRRAWHRLCSYEPHCGPLRPARAPRSGDRLCRFDRPFDRPAPALRNVSQWQDGESIERPIRQPRTVGGRRIGRVSGPNSPN